MDAPHPPPLRAAALPAAERPPRALVAPTPQRINKVLQSSSAPAQRSLFLRPSGAR